MVTGWSMQLKMIHTGHLPWATPHAKWIKGHKCGNVWWSTKVEEKPASHKRLNVTIQSTLVTSLNLLQSRVVGRQSGETQKEKWEKSQDQVLHEGRPLQHTVTSIHTCHFVGSSQFKLTGTSFHPLVHATGTVFSASSCIHSGLT